ncbi:MAG: FAD-dependent monooxygenase [Ghiorsea sp.]
MAKPYDVAIVGAGVVGSVLALHFSKLGYHVVLLDAYEPSFAISDPERVIALSEGSVSYLDSLGVWQNIQKNGAGLIQNITVREPGHAGVVEMSHESLGDNAEALGYVLEIRHVLEPVRLALAGDVNIMSGIRCLAIEQAEEGVSLQIEQQDKRHEMINAKLLVGADGANSIVRNLAGISTYGWDHNRFGIVASIACEHGHQNTAFECFKEEGPLALLPLADGRFSLVWSVTPKMGVELLDMDDEAFLQILSKEAGDDAMGLIGRFTSMGKRASFPLELRVAKSFAKQRVLLVGNAAHTIHPVAGQGMNLGLRDAAVLSEILNEPWAKDLSKPLIGPTYAERRRLDTIAVSGFTEGVLEAFSSSGLPQRWLRGKGLKGVQSVSGLKDLLLKHASGVAQLEGLKL